MKEFIFYTRLVQVILTGKRATSITELVEGIEKAEKSSIYYHTHRFLQQHKTISPEPPNDFAYWIGNILNIEWLSEQISSVNLVQFNNIEDIRTTYLNILRKYKNDHKYESVSPPGQEFQFLGSRAFVLNTGLSASNLSTFKKCLSVVDINSIIYHIFDARLPQGKTENDFTIWFDSIGKKNLASEVHKLDPYTFTLEGLRKHLINLVHKYEKN